MPRRTGATLIEVLVAIFIMGIGLICLLTLFPLGALRMAKAIQDDRCAQSGATASNVAAVGNFRNDSSVGLAFFGKDPLNGNQLLPVLNPDSKSYPVFLDPVGYRTAFPVPGYNNVATVTINGVPTPLLQRVQPGFIQTAPTAAQANFLTAQWFSLLDDLVFDTQKLPVYNVGYPKNLLAGVVERNTRFTWAYLLQRPRVSDSTAVDVAVVVYAGRPLGLTGNQTLAETKYDGYNPLQPTLPEVEYNTTTNVVRVRYEAYGSPVPQVRAGDWILDLSTVRIPAGSNIPGINPNATEVEVHAYFYRVTGVTEDVDASGQVYDMELQQPLRGFPTVTPTGVPTPTFGQSIPQNPPNPSAERARLLVLEGVAEVFERGLGKTP